MKRRRYAKFAVLCWVCLLSACGQSGPLYLPKQADKQIETVSTSTTDSSSEGTSQRVAPIVAQSV